MTFKKILLTSLFTLSLCSPSKAYNVYATYYGPGFHGHRTASGERFNAGALTCAHRTLPFGTRLKVQNPRNGRSVVVRVNDRGPFTRASLDLSQGAARVIGFSSGLLRVIRF